ncbi:MAG TPA: hypothetical protein VN663_02620 [Ramlibacter sp.]|nr:hypothetical protein [Ramlibacter sp.]
MTHSIKSSIVAALLAIGTLGVAAVANASTNAPLYAAPARALVPAQVAYDAPYAYDWRHEHGRTWRSGCRAPAWDPNARYMPGQTVWHNGYLYVATGLSASVWNVNSPPEWTPSYWVPAACR